MNIDQLKQDLCRQMAIIELIERSQLKAKMIACETYYVFAREIPARDRNVAKQNKVTQRLVNYLTVLTQKP